MKNVIGMAALTAIASAVVVVPSATPQDATARACPGVQLVIVNDARDSTVGNVDAGFLAQVTDPILEAANDDTTAPVDAGFSAPTPTATATADAGSGSWKPDVWGTQAASPQPSSVAQQPSTAQATESATNDTTAVNVGRTVVSVASTSDTRAYIPGVTGPDTTPAYEESIQQAVADTETVLHEISAQCPDTKVSLLGVGQGAQAVSIVSKKIGAGEVIDSSKVIGVAMFADPSRASDQPVVANGASAPAGASQAWDVQPATGAGVATVTGQTVGAESGTYGQLANRTVSWCATGDVACSLAGDTPLGQLVANGMEATAGKAPEAQLAYVADTLGPAVVLASVESLAEDVQFGDGGFSFKAASSPKQTLIGRIATESAAPVDQTEMQQRLLSAGMQIGGMALAAGVTVAKEVIKPANIAQIAAASAVSPAAGAGAALLIASGAAMDLVNERTLTTGARRLASEAQAVGIDDEGLAQAAVQAAVGTQVSKSAGAYDSASMTASGQSASEATTSWLADVVGAEIGRNLSTGSAAQSTTFDSNAIAAAMKDLA
ncbi:cutinase family protein [Corynebacterium flavescens]|uniref:cutinase family protein n=1 Tax=Corynebacterium flavescens TaxID=28028 RepID=UPI003FD21C46